MSRREAGERAEQLAEGIALEVRQALSELATAEQRRDLAERAAQLAERGLAIVEDRYREGLTTLPELLSAQTALTEAQLRGVAVRRDLLLAQARLDLATGDL